MNVRTLEKNTTHIHTHKMQYICSACGEEIEIQKKDHIKCTSCGKQCLMKKRVATQYLAR